MKNDLICFSHLRWNFVFQRPQHLMSRIAKTGRVFYFEEPVYTNFPDKLRISVDHHTNVIVVTPEFEHIQILTIKENKLTVENRLERLLNQLFELYDVKDYITWYYAPMAISFTGNLKPILIVYDCMDELSAFKFSPPELINFEKILLNKADVVFTGGNRLFEAKKNFHHNIHSFPSAIDKEFFLPARSPINEPADQENIPHPRLGFFGVLDERFDIDLAGKMATLKPDWHFIFIGPVVKIDEMDLPKESNIHYLGMKSYKDLPAYISGWDVCVMPFAINASTEFISPTKTPEFLAAGKRVISTPIHDVIHPYGDQGLVGIANDADGFIKIAERDMSQASDTAWLQKVDRFLSHISWDKTWEQMESEIDKLMQDHAIQLNRQTVFASPDNVINKER